MIPRRTSRKGETRQEWEDLQYFISINSLNWSINNEIRTTADSHDFNLLYFLSKYVLTRLRKLHIWGQCHGGGGGHQAAVDLLHGGVDVVLRGLHGPGRGGGDEVLWLEGLVWAVGVAAVGELVIHHHISSGHNLLSSPLDYCPLHWPFPANWNIILASANR